MKEKTVEIEIPLILPDLEDECDQCLERLQQILEQHHGIVSSHLECSRDQPAVCIHYRPHKITLEQVRRIAKQAGVELTEDFIHEQIPVTGLDNADEPPAVEQALEELPGMLHARVNYAAGLAFVAYRREDLDPAVIARTLQANGVKPIDWPPVEEEAEERPGLAGFMPRWVDERLELVLIVLTGVLLALGWAGSRWLNFPEPLPLILYGLAYLTGGWDILVRAVPGLFKGNFDTDVLMLAAAAGAAAIGEWAEGGLLLLLFSLGHTGEHYALNQARQAVNSLADMMPDTARVRRNGSPEEIPLEEIQIGDQVLVRPGERIPVDGEVLEGESAVDQSPITGESVPVLKTPGEEVFAATVNQDQQLTVQVTKRPEDNTLARLMELVAEAQSQQSPTQRFTERFTSWFVPSVLILVGLVIAVPPLAGWMAFRESFYRAMLLLVAASPCALALGTPAAVLTGIARAARGGVLIKGGAHLENLGALRAAAFDKTGTLTEGNFEVTDLIPLNGTSPDDLLSLAAAVELGSGHPLAKAVVREAREKELDLPEAEGLENLSGRGVRSRVAGKTVLIGTRELLHSSSGIPAERQVLDRLNALEEQGKSTMIVQHGGTLLGILALADRSRKGLRETFARLKKLGIHKLVMLTGDNPEAARRVGEELGMTDVRAGLHPEEKLTAVRELEEQYGRVAMIGDGINDAPALAAATVGIAMGGAGTAAALETADVALMADDLEKLPFAVGLSRASRRVIVQNLVIALGVIAVLILSSVLGWLALGWAVALHEGSSLAVVLNALRLLGYKE